MGAPECICACEGHDNNIYDEEENDHVPLYSDICCCFFGFSGVASKGLLPASAALCAKLCASLDVIQKYLYLIIVWFSDSDFESAGEWAHHLYTVN